MSGAPGRDGCRPRSRTTRSITARMVHRLAKRDYTGWLGVEYVWIDWEQCNECDNLSETILFRDFLRSLPT